jgi:ribosomal protein S18 acetylase RimI-like enzyme
VTVAAPRPTLRAVDARDGLFLRRLYASTREDELAVVPWNEDEKVAFLRQQFDAQDAYYREQYDGATYDVIEVEGEPAGRLYVARWESEIRIMDIALLPEYRGRGIGTDLLRALLDEGARSGKRVSIHVEKHNPAWRLYERLGFEPVADRGVHVLMEVPPWETKRQPVPSIAEDS